MKIKNKSFLAASILLWVTSMSYAFADMEISNWDSSIKMWDDWSMTISSSWSTIKMDSSNSNSNSDINLKWKIDWYKVILNWNKYEGNENILGYKIVLTNASWEEKTISVDPSKTSVENWDARAWVNKYILFVVWENWNVAESNSIVLSMWPNGWYDFSNWNNWNVKKDGNKKPEENRNQPLREQFKENRDEIKSNIGEFRQDNWFLIEYLSWYSQETRKQILDLKKEYQDKVFEIVKSSSWALTDDQKSQIDNLNQEFMSKVEPLVWDNEKALEFLKLRYDVFKDNQNLRDQNKEMRQDFKENFWKTNSWSILSQVNKDENKPKENWWLKEKYKKLFQNKIEEKIANLSNEQIKLIISKVETLVEKYKSSEDLTQDQKVKFVSQLQAIRDILNDKLLETEDTINLDELFQ
jgi:hypothetical protein